MTTERITARNAALITAVGITATISMVAYAILIAESEDAFLEMGALSVAVLAIGWTVLRNKPVALHVFWAGVWHSISWATAGFLLTIGFVNLENDGDMLLGFYLVGLFAGGLAGALYGCVLASRLFRVEPSRTRGAATGACAAMISWMAITTASYVISPRHSETPFGVLAWLAAHMIPIGVLFGMMLRAKRTIWENADLLPHQPDD